VLGRAPVQIDPAELERLCAMQCTEEEIAAWFGVSKKTIERRRKKDDFLNAMERGKAKGRVSLRRNLWKLANAGNVAACIFLAKNLLGYRDIVNAEHTGLSGGPIQLAAKPDLSHLSDEELRQLRAIALKTAPGERDRPGAGDPEPQRIRAERLDGS
jgi:hypothetical protein